MPRQPRTPSRRPIKAEWVNDTDRLVHGLLAMVGRYQDSIPGAVKRELSQLLSPSLELLIRSGRGAKPEQLDVLIEPHI